MKVAASSRDGAGSFHGDYWGNVEGGGGGIGVKMGVEMEDEGRKGRMGRRKDEGMMRKMRRRKG